VKRAGRPEPMLFPSKGRGRAGVKRAGRPDATEPAASAGWLPFVGFWPCWAQRQAAMALGPAVALDLLLLWQDRGRVRVSLQPADVGAGS